MKPGIQAKCLLVAAAATLVAFAADPNQPTVILPTSTPYPIANGIAPNGITASTGGIFFTQPFVDGKQPRGAYSITTGGAVSSVGSIFTLAGIADENGIAIATGAGSGFTVGDVYVTGPSNTSPTTADAIYKCTGGSCTTKIVDGLPIVAGHSRNSTLAFDSVGTFGGALILSAANVLNLYNASGTLLATYSNPLAGYTLQTSTVAPTTYSSHPGCIFTTAFPTSNLDNPAPTGNGAILYVCPGTPSGSPLSLFTMTTGIPEPESIQFITANSLSCTVGGFSFFGSGYATDGQINNPQSTTGAVLAWTPTQLTPYVGHYLAQTEEVTSGGHGAVYVDAGLATQTLFSDTTTATNGVGYQLEDTAVVKCPSPFAGCTVTQGGWGAAPQGNNPGAILAAKFSTVFPSGVTIGNNGAPFSLKFTSAAAIEAFLPQGGPPGALTASAVNPTERTSAGVFAGQVLALALNVGIFNYGGLVLTGTGTSLDNHTVAQILVAADIALGGGALPAGFTYSSLNDLIDQLNSAFDNCTPSSFATQHLH